jgi:hypothetical protein
MVKATQNLYRDYDRTHHLSPLLFGAGVYCQSMLTRVELR